jgi:hypothetical protein
VKQLALPYGAADTLNGVVAITRYASSRISRIS